MFEDEKCALSTDCMFAHRIMLVQYVKRLLSIILCSNNIFESHGVVTIQICDMQIAKQLLHIQGPFNPNNFRLRSLNGHHVTFRVFDEFISMYFYESKA